MLATNAYLSNCASPNCSYNNKCSECEVLQIFADYNPNPFFLFSNTLQLIFANKASENFFFKESTDDAYLQFYDIFRHSFESILRSDKQHTHFYYSMSSHSFKFNLVYNKQEERIYVYGTDITRERFLSAELSKQAELLSRILDNIPVDIVVFNTKHEYTFINKIAIKDDELRAWLIGKTDFDYCEKKGKDISLAKNRREAFNRAISLKGDIDYLDKAVVNNKEKFILRRYHPVIEKGSVVEVIGYGVDITEMVESKARLSKTYDVLFNSQVFLKQVLSYYVHNVKHPMTNIEGLLEVYNDIESDDADYEFVIKGLIKSFDELNSNFNGFTARLNNAFQNFDTEKELIDIKTSIIQLANEAMLQYPLKYKFRFLAKKNSMLCYYGFMYNKIIRDFFKFLAHNIDKSYINVTVSCKHINNYCQLKFQISNIHISASKLIKLKSAIKFADDINFQVNQNYLSDISCVLNCTGGFLNFDYSAGLAVFEFNFPNLDTNG